MGNKAKRHRRRKFKLKAMQRAKMQRKIEAKAGGKADSEGNLHRVS